MKQQPFFSSKVRKYWFMLFLLSMSVSLMLFTIFLTSSQSPVAASNGKAQVFFDGLLSASTATLSGQWLFPAKTLATELGAKYAYSSSKRTVTFSTKSSSFLCEIGKTSGRINGKSVKLLTACATSKNGPLVPLRAVGETFGATIGRLPQTNILTVSTLKKYSSKVVRVVDGDTIEIQYDGRTEKVRLIGVNTPETVHPTLGEQPYGREASNFSKSRLHNQKLRIEFDVGMRDKYGRLLAYAYLADGTQFNALLISEGYAQQMTYQPNVRWVELYRILQNDARTNNRGLWKLETTAPSTATGNAVDPQTYNAPSDCKTPLIKGNINSKGDKIYHVPGGYYYSKTKAEQMFCNENDALAAGFRKSKK